jgi:hypothetical protein
MEPWLQSRLGGIGEGLCAIGGAEPLTQLRLASKLASLYNPLPREREATITSAAAPEPEYCKYPHPPLA